MNKAEEVIIETFTRASIRIHWVFLANMVLTALVISSAYSGKASYDRSFIGAAQIFILDAEEKIQWLEKMYEGSVPLKKPNGTTAKVLPVERWSKDDRKLYGDLVSRQQRAINMLEKHSFSTATTPIISSTISPNDFDVFCGAIMIAFSVWIYFATNQVAYLVSHPKTRPIINSYRWAVRSVFVSFYSKEPTARIVFTAAFIFLPFVAMLVSTMNTMEVASRLDGLSYKDIISESYDSLVILKQAMTALLFFMGLAILVAWTSVLQKLRDDG